MIGRKSGFILIVLILLMFLGTSCNVKNEPEPTAIDLIEVRALLQELDDQFSEDFKNADSLALAAHYATDGTWGSIRGKDNLAYAWGKTIRYANENGTPYVNFIINSVSTDGEFVVEIGTFEFADIDDHVKSAGKYLVVRKLENGKWKMYRDIGL